ncbi:MAG: DUF1759 domain-containing protein [Candidatus Brocadiaceae bacterium]|nr:DUF1759 domain-containing protein [Candidatus Brocadiaceae bacterium]
MAKKLEKKCETILSDLDGLTESLESLLLNKEENKDLINLQSSNLKELLNDYKRSHYELCNVSNAQDLEEIKSKYNSKRNTFMAVLAKSNSVINSEQADLTPKSFKDEKKQNARLPKVHIQPFDGNVLDWPTFWDKFTALIDTSSISNVEKFMYLSSYLKGEAANVVLGLSTTAANYDVAKSLLCNRFGRKEKIVAVHIQSLLNLQNEKIDNLWTLHDKLQIHIRSLHNLGIEGGDYGVILTQIVLKSLPPYITLEWARNSEGKETDIKYLLTFLCDEIQRRERSQLSNSKGFKQKRPNPSPSSASALIAADTANAAAGTASSTVSAVNCAICGLKGHLPHTCRKLASRPVSQRREAAQRARLCFLCLKKGHVAAQCFSKKMCSSCGGRHHDLLHENKKPSAASTSTGHQTPKDPPSESNSQAGYASTGSIATLMQHAEVPIRGEKVSVIFDTGSDRSYITSDTAERLDLAAAGSELHGASGFGATRQEQTEKDIFRLDINDINLKLISIKDITTPLYRQAVPSDVLRKLKDLSIPLEENLAESKTIRTDILIGLDHYYDLVFPNSAISIDNALVAHNSKFGWFVSGKYGQ